MKTIGLFTRQQIKASEVSEIIIQDFPFKKVIEQNDENELFLGKYPREFYIIFSDGDEHTKEARNCFNQEECKNIPFNDWYYNIIYYWYPSVIKYVVNKIFIKYPELILYDEDSDTFYTPEKYLNSLN